MILDLAISVSTDIVLYDVSRTSFVELREVLPSVVMIAIGFLLLFVREERRYRIGSVFLLGGGFAFLILIAGERAIQHRTLVRRLRNGDYETVEGAMTNFIPGSFDGHRPEQFSVAGHTYTFHGNTSTAGYHDVQGPNGPLRDGIIVRIADVNGTIARFELMESSE